MRHTDSLRVQDSMSCSHLERTIRPSKMTSAGYRWPRAVNNFREIISQAQSRYKTLIVGPPPVKDPDHQERIKELSQIFEKLSQEIGVPYLSVFEMLSGDPTWMGELSNTDGCHPRDLGYTKLADLVGSWPSWWFGSLEALSKKSR